MQLRFELGDPQAPRGHAIVFARGTDGPSHIIATYCVVLPIQFSIGKYLPPILSGQMPLEGLGSAAATSAVPIPPMLEDVPSLAALRQLAEQRGDDLCELGTIYLSDDGQRMAYAAEACQTYAQLYAEYTARRPIAAEAPPAPLDDLDVEAVLDEVMTERDRVAEITRLVGQARYAIEVHDQRLLGEVSSSLRRHARALPEKYRGDQLVAAALRTDAVGQRLAELYLQRAYKLLGEEYTDIPPIEDEIRRLQSAPATGEQPTSNS